MPRCQLFVACVVAGLLSAGGCGGRGFVPGAGRVTLDGQPLAAANVTLLPDAAGQSPAVALTKKDGTFELSVSNDRGVFPGSYKVLIVKDMVIDPPPEPPATASHKPPSGDFKGLTGEALGRGMQQLSRFPIRSLIPERYGNPTQTPLKCTIPAGGIRDLLFELKTSSWRGSRLSLGALHARPLTRRAGLAAC